MMLDRRQTLGIAALGGLGSAATAHARHGEDYFLNPIVGGDRPDPAILKDGKDYYLTFSTFDAYPGLTIWHSRDLVNWQPRKPALRRNIGSVWAVSLAKHDGRYFLYIPVKSSPNDIFVIWADHIDGPWSEPVSLGLHNHIDPCHIADEDGVRWLFLSGGDRVRLSDDGLSVQGPVAHVYDPWRYPEDWDVESFSPEGSKVLRHKGWYYLLTAVGGTAGPPTGHMVIAARSRSLGGPWTQHPGNPLVRTRSAREAWWSRGHASLVEGPDGSWWAVYHGYKANFWTLGRQCLLDPVEWTDDGWFRMTGGDLSRPLRKPRGGQSLPNGLSLSDPFDGPLDLGRKWAFFRPGPNETDRVRVEKGRLLLSGRGSAPSSGSPLLLTTGDASYRFACDIELGPGGTAGLVLFYDDKLYCGLGFDEKAFVTHQYGIERGRPPHGFGSSLRLRITNRRHIVSLHTSPDHGKTWKRFDRGMEVSGYHHNVRGGFGALRPGLYAAGDAVSAFSNFAYEALAD